MAENISSTLGQDGLILVTGGAGLIGSAVVWHLNQLGYDQIVVVDHLSNSEKWRNLRALRFRDYYEKDVFSELLREGQFRGRFKVIFHLGACSDTTEEDASYLIGNNFAYGKLLCEYALQHGSRMIYASSAATYGNGECGFADDESRIDQLRPLNKYGFSKQIFDQYLLRRGLLQTPPGDGASFVGLKYSNVFGPNEYHKAYMRSMVLRSFEQIQASGRVRLFKSYRPEYGDGEQVRDFLYVKDAAAMTVFFMLAGRASCGLFNIGFGRARSWLELAQAMFDALGKPTDVEFIEMPEELRPRYQYYTCLETDKLRTAGYSGELTTLEVAVADYVRYLLKNAHLGDEI
jgi:ADP-L-glycero-D-manno-heptose 6-epimerase